MVRPATERSEETVTSSQFHLVDLAGSERAKKTGAEVRSEKGAGEGLVVERGSMMGGGRGLWCGRWVSETGQRTDVRSRRFKTGGGGGGVLGRGRGARGVFNRRVVHGGGGEGLVLVLTSL